MQAEQITLEDDERRLWKAADDIEARIAKYAPTFDGQQEVESYLQQVMMRLAPEFYAGNKDRPRMHVLINPVPNAFVLPNGATYVTSGLLVLLENEAQLATVLGHEFSHYQYRHSLRQHRKDENAHKAGTLFGIFLAGLVGASTGMIDSNLSAGAADLWTRVSVSGYSRDLEREADQKGLIAVLKAGYDPAATVKAFELLLAAAGDAEERGQGMFASHPRLSERIANYQEYLAKSEIKQYASGQERAEDRFINAILPVLIEDASFRIQSGDTQAARQEIARYRTARPHDAKAIYLLAETFKRESKVKGDENMMSAIAHYQQALELDPGCADCYREIGLLYRTLGDEARSRQFLSSYIELAPDRPDVPIIKTFIK